MASRKVSFTLDQPTLSRIDDAAARLAVPKSQVVREAVAEFHERIGRLSETERLRLLRAFDELVPRIPLGDVRSVERELSEIRRARRAGEGRPATTRNDPARLPLARSCGKQGFGR